MGCGWDSTNQRRWRPSVAMGRQEADVSASPAAMASRRWAGALGSGMALGPADLGDPLGQDVGVYGATGAFGAEGDFG